MKSALEILYDTVSRENPFEFDDDPQLNGNRDFLLQQGLTQQQRDRLLQMEDQMDLLADRRCVYFFREGLRLGLSLAELHQEEEAEI